MIKHHLIKPISATGISFVPQTKLSGKFCMRVELYGRKVAEKSSGEYIMYLEGRKGCR